VPLTPVVITNEDPIHLVFAYRTPPKVVEIIVSLIAVQMPTLMSKRPRRNKRFQQQDMNVLLNALSVSYHSYGLVAIWLFGYT